MSKINPDDESSTIRQIKKPSPIFDEKTWLRHKPNAQSGLIDIMILEAKNTKLDMAKKLMEVPRFKVRSKTAWIRRINEHLVHLSTLEGNKRNQIDGRGGHNLRVKVSEVTGVVYFDYP